MSRAIGIDLGTVNSCVASVVEGVPTVIADLEGRHLTPSVYAVTATGEPLVGHEAQAQAEGNRRNTIFAVKRFIGLKFTSEEVRFATKNLPYQIVAAPNGDAWVEVNGTLTSPEEVSAHILVKLKEVAEAHFGESVTHAVITVPAHFNDSQRQATKDAGRIAGLNVMRVLNEPTAAALAYGLGSTSDSPRSKRKVGTREVIAEQIVAVFDLGGGTFDVSILALRDGVFDVLSTHGDTYLGGEDFDLAIVQFVSQQFHSQTGRDLRQDRDMLQKLKTLAREAKHTLSSSGKAEIHIPFVTANDHLQMTIERRVFEKIVEPLLRRLSVPCSQAMQDAGVTSADIDDVILVGGMTRVPAVKKLCRQIFGKDPVDAVDADEAVALGAAVQAGILQGVLKGVSLNDVTSLSLGIETQGGLVQTMIPRNTATPVKSKKVFTTSSPNQPQVSIHLVQGESDFAPENMSLGRFELTDIRPASRGVPRISVEIEVDVDGIVHLAARDLDTGEEKTLDIVASSGLSETEIDELLRENTTVRDQRDRLAASRIEHAEQAGSAQGLPEESSMTVSQAGDLLQQLKSLVFMTQFQLDTHGKSYKGSARQSLENSLLTSRDLLSAQTGAQEMEEAIRELAEHADKLEKFIEDRH